MINPLLKFQKRVKCKMWKKWQLFNATDFQSLMYPCFFLCSILGIFPYKINHGSTFEISKQRYILSTVVLCVLCTCELVILYMIDIAGTINLGDIRRTLQRNCYFILGNFIAIVTYVLSGLRMDLLQAVINISSKLSLNSYKKLSRLIHTKDIFGFFFLFMMTMYYYSQIDHWYKALVPHVTFLVFQTDMLYINCVCILKACFKTIDNNLINLREPIANDEPNNPFLLMELKALKKQHMKISDTVEMLNMVFSLPLLATMSITFFGIIFELYYCMLHWKIGILINFNMDNLGFDIFAIGFMTFYTLKTVLIAWAGETGKDQAMKIGITVHDLLNNSSDKQIKNELRLFSLQVLHCENTFTVKGLIVDITLLTAIVVNTTTYVLILLQSLIVSYICNGKTNNVIHII
ncbi:PREDICTED: uncharacterized protein LOC105557303 [Vollenhovia emeryi]|uniref:uncharacterized protein LOC105557303 n=1 Tax=Vollenhovia emeryi TaxID=411798 RepID=UPI0005F36FB7|nr:PREDICTED: uncharacterized protein LOC105557303 [Vollenhovia emeryi]